MHRYRAASSTVVGQEDGFTLIELLVVVIIIGILAAVAVPVYLGTQNNAKNAGAKDDLGKAKIAVVAYFTDKGDSTVPTFDNNASTGLVKYGYVKSDTTTSVAFKSGSTPKTTSFCIEATSATTDKFKITDSSGAASGSC